MYVSCYRFEVLPNLCKSFKIIETDSFDFFVYFELSFSLQLQYINFSVSIFRSALAI